MFDRFFRLTENGTTVRTELLAGITTFLTMAYIIVVQPMVLSGKMFGFETGMSFSAVMAATCVSAAIATALMALLARYPIAQAPGMGENFFFVLAVCGAAAGLQAVKDGHSSPWQVALGVVFVSGLLFLLLSLLGVREMIIKAISPSMKNAMAVGIGLFIAFIGLQNAGLIVDKPGTLVGLNTEFASPDLLVFFFGLVLTAALHVWKVRGSILYGILGATALAVVLKLTVTVPMTAEGAPVHKLGFFVLADGVFSLPPSLGPTFFKMDVIGALSLQMIPFVIIFLFMDVFDTIGTLVGVSEQAGFVKDNELPRANRALLSDAIGTVVGACLGTSTVTSYIESAAGVERGGRTGLTGLTVAALFLLALFLSPIAVMIGSYPSITAPALFVVGAMMIMNVRKIKLADYSEGIPAFLTIVGIPLTYSIADGLALGFISYPLIKLLGGRGREVKWLMYLLAVVLLAYFVFVRSGWLQTAIG